LSEGRDCLSHRQKVKNIFPFSEKEIRKTLMLVNNSKFTSGLMRIVLSLSEVSVYSERLTKPMKLIIFLIFVGSIASVADAFAGPAVSSGPAQPDSGQGAVYAPATQIPSGVSPGLNARDSVAGQSGAGSQSSAVNGPSSGSLSSNGQNSSGNPYSNGFSNHNAVDASNLTRVGREKVMEVSAKELAAEVSRNQEKSEVTKKFEPSILNQGIDEIAKPSATTKITDSRAKNPVTDAALSSTASEGARSSPQKSTEPAASAATSPHP
jgi:hypothetical protein